MTVLSLVSEPIKGPSCKEELRWQMGVMVCNSYTYKLSYHISLPLDY